MVDHPRRIQRLRTKGWRMPAGAVYVGRPTMWGNPWLVAELLEELREEHGNEITLTDAREAAVESYRAWLDEGDDWRNPGTPDARDRILRNLCSLRGKHLACWCPLDQPCHADVLIDLANRPLCCEATPHG